MGKLSEDTKKKWAADNRKKFAAEHKENEKKYGEEVPIASSKKRRTEGGKGDAEREGLDRNKYRDNYDKINWKKNKGDK